MNKQQLSGSAVFITFSGNCKQALSFYQTCFGGALQLDTFEQGLQGYPVMPTVSGSLVAERITIHGSDLVHEEGRRLGNYIAIYLHCANAEERRALIERLESGIGNRATAGVDDQKLIEITDDFDVRWVLGV